MKKLLGLFLIGLMVLSLSACGMFSEEDVDDIVNCVENPDDPSCEEVIPDDDDDRTAEEILIDTMIENYNVSGDLTFLSTAINSMDFSSALGQTTSLYLEVTEDIDETHYIDAVITDKFVDNNGMMILERHVVLDIDGEESIDITMYFEEVDMGVHVYVERAPIVAELDQTAQNELAWMGFESEYVLFQFDDTIENMIQIEMMKDILADMFFDDVGHDVFVNAQAEIDNALGITSATYNVNLDDLFTTLVINEDVAGFETKLQAIDYDGLLLAIDQANVAPMIVNLLNQIDASDGTVNGTVGSITISDAANILTNDTLTNYGTEYWLNNLTPQEMTDFKELVVKPTIEQNMFMFLTSELTHVNEIEAAVLTLINNDTGEMAYYKGIDSDTLLTSYQAATNFETWFNSLTSQEVAALEWAAMQEDDGTNDNYYQDMVWDASDIANQKEDIIAYLTTHQTALEALSHNGEVIDVNAMLNDLNTGGLTLFLQNLSVTDIEILVEGYVYPKLETLMTSINNNTVLEGVIEIIWGDPHIEEAVRQIPHFDGELWLTNIQQIDPDALQTETLNVDSLLLAMRAGQTTFDAYVTSLSTTAPNMALLLAPFSPTVLYLEQYSDYGDDIEYALNNLDQFDPYLNLEYYLNHEDMTGTLSRTEETTLLVEMDLTPSMYESVYTEFVEDAYTYLSGFKTLPVDMINDYTSHLECQDGAPDTCDDIMPYTEAMNELSGLAPIDMTMEYDPNNINRMDMMIDLTTFADQLVTDNYNDISSDIEFTPDTKNDIFTGVNEFTINITMTDSATVTLPTELDDANALLTEHAKLNLIWEVESLLYDIEMYDMSNNTDLAAIVNTARTLDQFDYWVETSAVIDDSKSTVTWDGTEYTVELHWVGGDDATDVLVFTESISESDLASYLTNGEITTEADYDALIALIDDDNYSLTKLLMYYFFE
ncbi:MAG: hypothetical protein UMR38_06245 [Candidatus Izemoplasma sp.]|nr:hypothetical protein [Candidatus Izemoplasma sp.]